MKVNKVISKRFRTRKKGVQADADVNITIAANIGEKRGSVNRVSSRQRARGSSWGSSSKGGERPDSEGPDRR